jgi:hypothetical protein
MSWYGDVLKLGMFECLCFVSLMESGDEDIKHDGRPSSIVKDKKYATSIEMP